MNDVELSPRDQVTGPAKWLKIYAYVAIVGAAISLLFSVAMMVGLFDAGAGTGGAVNGVINIFFSLVAALIGFMTLKAAANLENLENWTFVLIFSILAIVPCTSGCCLLGLPIGIWVAIVINKAEVKEAFTS